MIFASSAEGIIKCSEENSPNDSSIARDADQWVDLKFCSGCFAPKSQNRTEHHGHEWYPLQSLRNCGAASVGVLQDKLVLSTGLMWTGHRKEIRRLTFRAFNSSLLPGFSSLWPSFSFWWAYSRSILFIWRKWRSYVPWLWVYHGVKNLRSYSLLRSYC